MTTNKKVADIILDTLLAAGVQRVYALVGDPLNGLAEAIAARDGLAIVGVRHEEAGAFSAGTDAVIGGGLAVCAGACGPGIAHLLNGLYDCHRSHAPVLAIAAQIPSPEIGSGYFQEAHPRLMFQECSHYCETIAVPEQAVRVTEAAIQAALGIGGVGVIIVPHDVLAQTTEAPAPRVPGLGHRSAIVPASTKIAEAAAVLNACERVTILAGSGTEGAHAELLQAAQALQAPVVHALRGKECVEASNPFDVGMTGELGMPAGAQALQGADGLLMLGTDFPYREYLPEQARVVQVDKRPENLGRRARVEVGLHGTVAETLVQLLPLLRARPGGGEHLRAAQRQHAADALVLATQATGEPGAPAIRPQHLTRLLDELAADDAIYICDVGTPLLWVDRYLHMNGRRRLVNSFVHGSQAAALPQAIGAALAAPGRQVIALCGDSSLTMLLSELLTLHRTQAAVKVIIYNNGLADAAEAGIDPAQAPTPEQELNNPDFVQLATGARLHGLRVSDPAQLEATLREALAYPGPVVVDVTVTREDLRQPAPAEQPA